MFESYVIVLQSNTFFSNRSDIDCIGNKVNLSGVKVIPFEIKIVKYICMELEATGQQQQGYSLEGWISIPDAFAGSSDG
jgi:hypothetical protein